jgi:hypothetical protein
MSRNREETHIYAIFCQNREIYQYIPIYRGFPDPEGKKFWSLVTRHHPKKYR